MLNIDPDSIRIEDYAYNLPDERIAGFPLENRAASKLLVYDRGKISHTTFSDLPGLAGTGGLMIFNNTRVIQARILMHKDTGTRIEILLLEPLRPAEYALAFSSSSGCIWKCMVGNKKRWKRGKLARELTIDGEKASLFTEIVKDNSSWQEIEFSWNPEYHHFSRVIDCAGLTPIPPYLNRMPDDSDKLNYQTIYARFEGSVAAPTAGLHFTGEILEKLKKNNILTEEITLHVGAGTFQPVKSATASGHPMHAEHFTVSVDTIENIIRNLKRITAVGTTSVRTLESIYWLGVKHLINPNKDKIGHKKPFLPGKKHLPESERLEYPLLLSQWEHTELPTDIPVTESLGALVDRLKFNGLSELDAKTEMMIIPGYKFRLTDRLITNFHLPGSTLLLLISAFIGEDWKKVYNYALENDFRFLSYGDSSLLIPQHS